MAQNLTLRQRELLEKLSRTQDSREAKVLCEAFLALEPEMEQEGKKPSTVQELFQQLMDGGAYSDGEIRDFLTRNGGHICKAYVPIVFSRQDTENDLLMQELSTIPETYSFFYDGHHVLLVEFDHEPLPTPQLSAIMKNHGLCCGAGRPCGDLSQISIFVRQGYDTLKYMQVLKQDAVFCTYDQFTMIRLLDRLQEGVDFNGFQIEDVRAIQNYDIDNQTELCRTLLCYLENSKSTSRTAEELHIHRNSVYYRINKCMELLPEVDFDNGIMSFLVMLSLYIAQYDYYLGHK